MSKQQHTPGPWALSSTFQVRKGRNGHADLVGVRIRSSSMIDRPEYPSIAEVFVNPDTLEREPEQRANARLIAAAPEMLEALEAVFQARAWQLNFDFAGHSDMQKLVSAIKKAKGEL